MSGTSRYNNMNPENKFNFKCYYIFFLLLQQICLCQFLYLVSTGILFYMSVCICPPMLYIHFTCKFSKFFMLLGSNRQQLQFVLPQAKLMQSSAYRSTNPSQPCLGITFILLYGCPYQKNETVYEPWFLTCIPPGKWLETI